MRANVLSAILLLTSTISGAAFAQPPSLTPRVPISLALDGNSIATTTSRHPNPVVTGVAPEAAQHDAAAVGHAEELVRNVVIPHYVMPETARQPIHELSLTPFSPYVGAYGLNLNIETRLLH
jgi:hypothetical protein